jgi:hypothetical protein
MNGERLCDSFPSANPFEWLKLLCTCFSVRIIVIKVFLVHTSLSTNGIFQVGAFVRLNYDHFIEVGRTRQGTE